MVSPNKFTDTSPASVRTVTESNKWHF